MGRISSAIRSAWEWTVKSRYTCYLEQELDRTRAELKQWQDIFLTEQGLPKLTPPTAVPLPHTRGRMLPSQFKAKLEAFTTPKEPKSAD